jgi:hypothetical protein
LGLLRHVFARIANTARAVITPMNRMLIIYAVFSTVSSKSRLKTGILHLVELKDVGNQSCCPRIRFCYLLMMDQRSTKSPPH